MIPNKRLKEFGYYYLNEKSIDDLSADGISKSGYKSAQTALRAGRELVEDLKDILLIYGIDVAGDIVIAGPSGSGVGYYEGDDFLEGIT